MNPGSVARALRGLVTAGAAGAAYALVARPWYLRWGATDEEVMRALPGDDLAKDSAIGSTRAVTIRAPVEDVWPWLGQIGYGRGGFYSYDGLENLFVRLLRGTPGYRSAQTIVPEHQRLSPGDFIPSGPPDMLSGRLAAVAGWKVGVTASGATVLERLARVARRPRCRLAHWGRKTGRRHEVTISVPRRRGDSCTSPRGTGAGNR